MHTHLSQKPRREDRFLMMACKNGYTDVHGKLDGRRFEKKTVPSLNEGEAARVEEALSSAIICVGDGFTYQAPSTLEVISQLRECGEKRHLPPAQAYLAASAAILLPGAEYSLRCIHELGLEHFSPFGSKGTIPAPNDYDVRQVAEISSLSQEEKIRFCENYVAELPAIISQNAQLPYHIFTKGFLKKKLIVDDKNAFSIRSYGNTKVKVELLSGAFATRSLFDHEDFALPLAPLLTKPKGTITPESETFGGYAAIFYRAYKKLFASKLNSRAYGRLISYITMRWTCGRHGLRHEGREALFAAFSDRSEAIAELKRQCESALSNHHPACSVYERIAFAWNNGLALLPDLSAHEMVSIWSELTKSCHQHGLNRNTVLADPDRGPIWYLSQLIVSKEITFEYATALLLFLGLVSVSSLSPSERIRIRLYITEDEEQTAIQIVIKEKPLENDSLTKSSAITIPWHPEKIWTLLESHQSSPPSGVSQLLKHYCQLNTSKEGFFKRLRFLWLKGLALTLPDNSSKECLKKLLSDELLSKRHMHELFNCSFSYKSKYFLWNLLPNIREPFNFLSLWKLRPGNLLSQEASLLAEAFCQLDENVEVKKRGKLFYNEIVLDLVSWGTLILETGQWKLFWTWVNGLQRYRDTSVSDGPFVKWLFITAENYLLTPAPSLVLCHKRLTPWNKSEYPSFTCCMRFLERALHTQKLKLLPYWTEALKHALPPPCDLIPHLSALEEILIAFIIRSETAIFRESLALSLLSYFQKNAIKESLKIFFYILQIACLSSDPNLCESCWNFFIHVADPLYQHGESSIQYRKVWIKLIEIVNKYPSNLLTLLLERRATIEMVFTLDFYKGVINNCAAHTFQLFKSLSHQEKISSLWETVVEEVEKHPELPKGQFLATLQYICVLCRTGSSHFILYEKNCRFALQILEFLPMMAVNHGKNNPSQNREDEGNFLELSSYEIYINILVIIIKHSIENQIWKLAESQDITLQLLDKTAQKNIFLQGAVILFIELIQQQRPYTDFERLGKILSLWVTHFQISKSLPSYEKMRGDVAFIMEQIGNLAHNLSPENVLGLLRPIIAQIKEMALTHKLELHKVYICYIEAVLKLYEQKPLMALGQEYFQHVIKNRDWLSFGEEKNYQKGAGKIYSEALTLFHSKEDFKKFNNLFGEYPIVQLNSGELADLASKKICHILMDGAKKFDKVTISLRDDSGVALRIACVRSVLQPGNAEKLMREEKSLLLESASQLLMQLLLCELNAKQEETYALLHQYTLTSIAQGDGYFFYVQQYTRLRSLFSKAAEHRLLYQPCSINTLGRHKLSEAFIWFSIIPLPTDNLPLWNLLRNKGEVWRKSILQYVNHKMAFYTFLGLQLLKNLFVLYQKDEGLCDRCLMDMRKGIEENKGLQENGIVNTHVSILQCMLDEVFLGPLLKAVLNYSGRGDLPKIMNLILSPL